MLTNNPLPAFRIVTRRANLAPIIFSRIYKNLGEPNEQPCLFLEPAPFELSTIASIYFHPFYIAQSETSVLAPHPLTIHPI